MFSISLHYTAPSHENKFALLARRYNFNQVHTFTADLDLNRFRMKALNLFADILLSKIGDKQQCLHFMTVLRIGKYLTCH